MKTNKLYKNIIYPVISLGLLILIWFVTAKVVDIELIIPSISATVKEFFALLGQKQFYSAILGTLNRTLISFLLAFIMAIALAIISAFLPFLNKLLSPIVTVVRAIPTMSLILLTIIWLNPQTSPLLIGFVIVFPIMYSSFYTAIISVDNDLIQMSKAYNVSKKDMVLSLYLPNIAPSFFDTVRSTISLNLKIIISAEVLAQTKISMGVMMQMSKAYLETAQLLAWTLVAIILSYLLEIIVYSIKKATIRWEK
ncbi:MAG: ABC transporter permease subunit [Clostridiales bacterium]|nr:ABC transporter permease subunit [Clostridiales bacterium]